MTMTSSTTNRTLSILDVLDEHGTISATLLLEKGASRSTVYRDLAALVEAGLLLRNAKGYYVAGPRYNPQPAGSRFDRAARTQKMIARIKEMRFPEKGRPARFADISEELGISPATIRKLIRHNP